MVTLDPGPARWIAGKVLSFRQEKPISTVSDFLEICKGLKTGKKTLNEATLPFLAVRIAVNGELDNLKNALPKAYGLLEDGGCLIVITFHSKEEEIVKEFFLPAGRQAVRSGSITPSLTEIDRNPRSRSAKMRILQKHDNKK